MTFTTHTIEELTSKPKGELQAIFRKATGIMNSPSRPNAQRDAARKTLDNLAAAMRGRSGPKP